MAAISKEQARALLFNRKLKSTSIPDTTIDAWESDPNAQDLVPLKGQLLLLELRGSDTSDANKLAELPDGTVDPVQVTAVMIARSLVLSETKERIFTDSDTEAVAAFGLSVLKPLETLVVELSGMTPPVVDAAKKNSSATVVNASSSSSVENSVAAPTESGVAA